MANKVDSPDAVVLHQFPRTLMRNILPNASPYALKVETWLRLAKIPYKLVETSKGSKSTGLIPYVILNGTEEITDSNIIISRLAEHFKIDPYEGCTAEQRGAARAFQKMLDENTVWTTVAFRYIEKADESVKYFELPGPSFMNWAIKGYIKRTARSKLSQQGLGKLPLEEIVKVAKDDIRAVSQYLGDKPFLLGEKCTAVDCSVFGQLVQLLYLDIDTPQKEVVREECTNIMPYLDRIRDLAWPDWHSICTGKPLP